MSEKLNNKIVIATKWSALTELLSKLVTPITSMVMARLLTPEAYGVVATFSIIITLADIFSDAGFQKYLIQREFKDDEERLQYTNVAFWSNLVLSFLLWGLISVFCQPLAKLVGSPGLGLVLVVSCAGIPLNGFCSIQMSLMKRDFDFRTLFWRKLVAILVPICITIPLAIYLRNYWALVLGTLAMHIVNAVFLSFRSNWTPSRFYSFGVLKEMFSFCAWSLLDSILIWLTSYSDIFFIGAMLNSYYLGLYRTSISIVGQIVSLITATVLPVIMPSLSRLQNDLPEMRRMLLRFQKLTGIILLPLGFGLFVFRDVITNVMLGSQWTEAAGFLGLWGLMEAITVVFARFCSPVYPAVGKPRISVLVQFLHVIVLIPAIIIAGGYGFKALYITRSLVRLELVLINLIAVYLVIKQSPILMLSNIKPQFVVSLMMALLGYILLSINNSLPLSIVWVLICIVFYFVVLYYLFPKERDLLLSVKQMILTKHK